MFEVKMAATHRTEKKMELLIVFFRKLEMVFDSVSKAESMTRRRWCGGYSPDAYGQNFQTTLNRA